MEYRILKNVDSKIKINIRTDKNGDVHYDKAYEVDEHLKSGWTLYGKPFLNSYGKLCQAMITDSGDSPLKRIADSLEELSNLRYLKDD
jgi:hypothetical protein